MRKFLILIGISVIWTFTVASSPVVTGAKVRLNAKKYKETVEVLQENKAQYPDDPELFYYLARGYAGMAQWNDAGQNFSLALQKNPDRKLAKEIEKWRDYYWGQFIRDASALLDQKRFLPAIDKFRTANVINPDRQESHANLGVALLEQAQLYESAQPPQPDSAQMFFDQAIESIKRAIELQPENEQFVKNLGQAYIMAGRLDEAVEVYEKYLEDYPEDIAAKKRLVTIYMSRQDYDNASEMYDALFDDAGVEMTAADYFNAGNCYYQMYFKLEKSENEEEKAKAKEFLEKSGECYRFTYDGNPKDCEAGEQLYYIYIYLEKWEDVLKTIDAMLSNGCERSYATLTNLGVAYLKLGDQQKAAQIFKEAEEKKPVAEQSQK
ncbi:MAG: tetratricopeptide repeat protein [Candidatus Glassbacteria bacterium]